SSAYLGYAYRRNEQDLYFPALIDHWNVATVTQQHVRATGPNLELMHWFGIRPVVLVRNLFDTVVSIRDYLFTEGFNKFPSLYVTEQMADLTRERQFDLLILHALPWYFNFYVSWFDTCRQNSIDALWLRYDDLIQDWAGGIRQVLDFYHIQAPEQDIHATLERLHAGDPSEVRINVGVSGRGNDLTEPQRDRIREQAACYPWVDFTAVGID
ncbi:MAG TPA: sulfotransferase domain-containing protein, partial [Gemmatimonadales bacterium]|nr:sulfotransferase domain-containing protein [Gemmatimonadales bacterium]